VTPKPTLLWLSGPAGAEGVRQAVASRWTVVDCHRDESLTNQLSAAGLAVACPNGEADDPHEIERLLTAIDRAPAVAVVLLPPDAQVAWNILGRHTGKFVLARQDADPAEILAKIEAAASLQPALSSLHAELADARKLAKSGAADLKDLDEEMRLAARLQRDFLPRRLPEVGPVRFGVLYRPLGWVSGDIYDVVRLDETHVGFYVADAVGHGMPAALLTMFIKRALQTKRIVGNTYQILPPHASLGQLNAAICEQNLSSCQFCTACYCVLDTESLQLTYARAGHPEGILIRADGPAEKLPAPGSLLGVFPEEQYESRSIALSPGDRLVLFTDGLEDAVTEPGAQTEGMLEMLASLRGEGRDEMLLQITAWIDARCGAGRAADDVTVVVMDVG